MHKPIALAAAVLAMLWSANAFACKCKQTRDRDESFRTYQYVFYGEAVDKEGSVALRVKTNFKGTRAKRTYKVEQPDNCAFPFESDKTYMVYAERGDGKGTVVVSRCSATAELVRPPITAFIWTLADELAYKTPRKQAERHRTGRNTLTARAVKKIKFAVRSCDPKVWKARGEMKARVEVRFDIQPDGSYEHVLRKYETPNETTTEISSCLAEKLAEDNFKRFPGGPVSVAGYWLIDKLDASFGEDRDSAVVLALGSDKRLLE